MSSEDDEYESSEIAENPNFKLRRMILLLQFLKLYAKNRLKSRMSVLDLSIWCVQKMSKEHIDMETEKAKKDNNEEFLEELKENNIDESIEVNTSFFIEILISLMRNMLPAFDYFQEFISKSSVSEYYEQSFVRDVDSNREKNLNDTDVVKLLLIGDVGVGKSSLLLRYVDDTFQDSINTPIGSDFKNKTIEIDSKHVKLQIWHMAGQKQSQTITTAYYRGAMGILVVYDVTNRASFENVGSWMRNIENHASKEVNKILIGNKSDLPNRVITEEKGKNLAARYNIHFVETSAKNNHNVQEAFETIAQMVKTRLYR